jgi:hypothetical protein
MRRVFILLGMVGTMAAVMQPCSAATPSVATLHKRQISDCMSKQMSASRTISYNEASKLCKQQIKTQNASLASGTATKPGASH